jgi:hypothetical protein
MSIQDFYRKFVSMSEENAVVEMLRRLSLIEDPMAMLTDEADWNQWPSLSQSIAAGQA